jgi:hypothetical protein
MELLNILFSTKALAQIAMKSFAPEKLIFSYFKKATKEALFKV